MIMGKWPCAVVSTLTNQGLALHLALADPESLQHTHSASRGNLSSQQPTETECCVSGVWHEGICSCSSQNIELHAACACAAAVLRNNLNIISVGLTLEAPVQLQAGYVLTEDFINCSEVDFHAGVQQMRHVLHSQHSTA
jgi:hypothetical protein